ncbi:hypothetical protein [Streptomyces sp. NPDC058045]|uniref:hypothetical protein n=1 Tax=Streptomyces sp. NPDC058045 TaxID=3346311 RepID=UPI0036EFCF47
MTAIGADEHRARYYLHRAGARPIGHLLEHPVPDQPITPTRIIPAGAELPKRAPEPGEVPPWRAPARTEPVPTPEDPDPSEAAAGSGPSTESADPAETAPDPRSRTRIMRADWWRTGSKDNPLPGKETPVEEEPQDQPVQAPQAPAQPVKKTDADDDQAAEAEEGEQDKRPAWDPTRIAERTAARINEARKETPFTQRITSAVVSVATADGSLNRVFYAASGMWAAWKIGFTPWLQDATSDAPVMVSLVVCLIGWAIHRSTKDAALPLAWAGHATATATVIAFIPHL